MRSTRLVLLSAAAASALAIAPAGAQARPNGRARVRPHAGLPAGGPCRIKLEVQHVIASGEKTTIVGHLLCPSPEQESGKLVTVYQQSAPKPGFVQVGQASTEAGGGFQLTPPQFETNSVFYATAEGAQSARREIRVQAQVTPGPPTPPEGAMLLTRGGRRGSHMVTFAGVVSPADEGSRIVLQREGSTANEEWRAIQFGTVGAGGKYVFEHNFVVPGDANIRVVVHPRGINAPAASTPSSYEISQAENPALTLESSADPIAFGQSVTLKGVVAGAAAGTPVTLLAHGKKAAFAPIATTHTTEGGKYEFTQTPSASTAYRATTATAHSAIVFEGVKYVLSTAAPTGTPQVGQPLTFSGTVLPALSGHVVYVERQNSLHLSWHVVDVGTVGTPAKPGEAAPFSIVHTFYAQGLARLRLVIPGDPSNQDAVGTPFEVDLAPAPASALRPQPPARLPVEGQL